MKMSGNLSEKTLVFCHANGICASSYEPLLQRLSIQPVIAIEKLGHQPSYGIDNNWGSLAEELNNFIRQRVAGQVIAIGHSLGALVSFIASRKDPKLFQALVMLDPPVVYGPARYLFKIAKCIGLIDWMTPAGKTRKRRRTWQHRLAAREYFAKKALYRQFHSECFDAFAAASVMQTDAGVELVFDVDKEVEIFRTTPDNLPSYSAIPSVAGLLIRGEQSESAVPRWADSFARQFGFEQQTTKGSHMFPLEHPQTTASMINCYIERL